MHVHKKLSHTRSLELEKSLTYLEMKDSLLSGTRCVISSLINQKVYVCVKLWDSSHELF